MGCDIHIVAEKRVNGQWEIIPRLHPLDWRSYGMYGFLANVRNYSAVPPISAPRGCPDDSPARDDQNDFWLGDHSFSWLSVEELCAFDYDRQMEDRSCGRQIAPNMWSGAETCEPGEGEQTTFRAFLGDNFFRDLAKLKEAGAERIVFGFDS